MFSATIVARRWPAVAVLLAAVAAGAPVRAQQTIVHDTQSEFAPGIFDRTALEGAEATPEIRLGTYSQFAWVFDDDAISGWTLRTQPVGNGVAEEAPAGQIHLATTYLTEESYALALRQDVSAPATCTAEFRVFLDAIAPSGVADPFATQPTGACCRLDVARSDAGFRLDVFTDRLVSFYREGSTGVDYPTLSSVDLATTTGQWYTFRFEIDFTALTTQVYRDDVWVGEFLADARNAAANTVRVLAYSRAASSGLAECHVDRVRVGGMTSGSWTSGTYTSAAVTVDAAEFGALSWTEIGAWPYPWGPWVKNPANPVLPAPCLNENLACDIADPLQQPLLFDGKYWMAYATGGMGGTIRLAWTADPGLMSWTDYAGNPVLAPGAGPNGEESYVYSPHLCREGDTWYLFYDVSLAADGRQRNAYATAPAPTGPWTKGQVIVDRGPDGAWDDYRVSEPHVFREGDTYFLYYMGDHVCSGCNEQVGLATTTAALFPLGPEPGGLWTKHGLVLPHDPDPTGWDRGLVADPSVLKVGDVYFMRYTGSYANEHWQLGTAWATSPYGPWQRPAGPDIALGAPGAWDDDRLVRGAIHYHDGRWYSPYTGHDGSAYRGGMASADPVAPEQFLNFATRTSGDGVAWEEWRPVANGATIASTPARYLQYRASFAAAPGGVSPALTSVTVEVSATVTGVVDGAPRAPLLLGAHPNPFNPGTVIEFELPRAGHARLVVHDLNGRLVRTLVDGALPAGRHAAAWDGRDAAGEPAASGLYFCTLASDGHETARKMTLLK